MTTVRFETCSRPRAHRFLEKLYPNCTVDINHETVVAVLDLVEADRFRIPDPDFHSGAILPGPKWEESERENCTKALLAMHEHILSTESDITVPD